MIHIFIINPFAGHQTFADDLRTKLSTYDNLEYFVFNTRYKGYETELVKKILHIFEGEKLRFYCCGGSGTMRNMLNGFDDFSNVEVAFYPCGLTNDYLKVYGKEQERFRNIDELINGDVIDIDYIKTNHGIALNTLSTGLDSNCQTKMDQYRSLRIIGDKMPYTLAIMYSIFVSKPLEYNVIIDDNEYTSTFSEIYFGNGFVLGGNIFFAEHTCSNDGKALTCLSFEKRRGLPLATAIMNLMKKKFSKVEKKMNFGEAKTISIRRTDNQPFTINFDGELVFDVTECKGEIVHKGLRFVVPEGVRV